MGLVLESRKRFNPGVKFGYTILYVRDVPRAVAFYEDAFGLGRRFVHEAGMYAEMDTGATTLAFAAYGLAKSNLPCGFQENSLASPPAGFEIAFITDDVAAAYQRALDAGATAVSGPATKPWGQVVAFVRDKDGITVELCSPSTQS
jgi:catechol 2,3-dioxygenase-like lactoylglutathione lyase family enzyme